LKIRYVGELLDNTGYGIAARINIALLHKMGHELQCLPVGNKQLKEQDWKMNIVANKMDFDIEDKPDVTIVHLYPPFLISKYRVKNVPTIAYVAWETDMLPSIWTNHLNISADIVITTCSEMKKVFEKSGINKPCFYLGPTIFNEDNPDKYNFEESTDFIEIKNSQAYKFYSIFQWIERKDPNKLVSAYVQEFDRNEDVMLIMKTYGIDRSEDEIHRLTRAAHNIAKGCGILYPPSLRIVSRYLTTKQIAELHNISDCYVMSSRGEGTCLPAMEAIIHNNPLISTSYGGPADFTDPKYTRYLEYRMIPVQNDPRLVSYFNYNMKWADVDIMDLRKALRHQYETRKMNDTTDKAYDYLHNVYSLENNKETMNNILQEAKKCN